MKNRQELIKKLSSEVKSLSNQIEHKSLYNARNFVIKILIKCGIAIDYALPFIVVAIIIFYRNEAKGNTPFLIDEITEKASIETIDTSTGYHLETTSFDYDYDKEELEYSTGWIINEYGLYERKSTIYKVNKDNYINNIEDIFAMSKEEMDNLFTITDMKTISKKNLEPGDEIYNEDAFIITNHFESEEETMTRSETTGENVLFSLLYIIVVLLWGNSTKQFMKIFVKTYIRDRLKEYEPMYKIITPKEIETLKEILAMKKENLILLDESAKSISYSLRKNNISSEENSGVSKENYEESEHGNILCLRR